MIEIKLKGTGLQRMQKAVQAIGEMPGKRAYATALNNVGKVAQNKVTNTVAKQAGVRVAVARKRGAINSRTATPDMLAFKIGSTGEHFSLKDTNARQGKAGAASSPWSTRRVFGHTFMGPRPGLTAIKLGGHVFVRSGEAREMKKGANKGQVRQPIRKLWGASIPKEIVQDASKEVFESYTAKRLPIEVGRQIKRAAFGVFD